MFARATLAFLLSLSVAERATAVVVDFETVPSLPQGPNLFATAGPMQTIEAPGIATVSGGVVLGVPTLTPAVDFASRPNLYGTANHPSGNAVGHPSLLSTVTIDIDPAEDARLVEGLILNGLIFPDTFTVQAFGPGGPIEQVVLENVPRNRDLGFRAFSVNGEPITRVTIAPSLASGEWDYFVDSIAINEPIPFCPTTPKSGCIVAGRGKLSVDERKPGAERVALSLGTFDDATTAADLGITGLATRYDVCVYGPGGERAWDLIVDRVGATCGTKAKPCWKGKGSKGFVFKDPNGVSDGVRKIVSTSGPRGRGGLVLIASNDAKKGQAAQPLGLAAALVGAARATLQVNALGGACFEATLSAVKKADQEQFKAGTR